VSLVHDPDSALAAAAQETFDAFVLDIGLPGMDGYALARRLRAGHADNTATFIALTGYGSAGDKHRGGEAGFDHYLVKPADLGELAGLLLQAC
jgi:DNA-binding response OmpR family regulator